MDGILVDRAFLEDRRTSALELTTVAELAEQGLAAPHIVANILAASALARSLEVTPAAIRDALRGFRLDPHRIEVVAVAAGVTWVDDSKATNPHAAASSLAAYPGAVWVVGGLLKGVDISDLVAGRGGTREGRDRDRRRPRRRSSRRSRDTRPRCRCSRWTPMRLKRSWHGSSNWRPGSRVTGTSFCSPPPRHPSTSSPPTPTAAGDSPPRCESGSGGGPMASTTQTRPGPVLRQIAPDPQPRRGLAARVSLGRVFAPVPSEFLLIASTALLLTGFGLVMVLSATSATATAAGEPPYEAVIKQAVFAVIGIPLMFIASRLPICVLEARRVAGAHRRRCCSSCSSSCPGSASRRTETATGS